MTKRQWERRITDEVVRAGLYQVSFDSVINSLADILEQRDLAFHKFRNDKLDMIQNGKINQLLVLWDNLNKTALAYWRELGLTPASLRKINEGALKTKNTSSLEEVLRELEA